jgi:hypothetical protein
MPVVLAGWLEKKGHLIKNWKRRYVTIEDSELSYYLDESLRQKKGGILLDQTTKVLVRDGTRHSWKFRILSHGKSLELSAVSEQERDFWVTTIRELFRTTAVAAETATTQSMSLSSSEKMSIHLNPDSHDLEEESDDDDDDDTELYETPLNVPQQAFGELQLPDIPSDILPDLDDLIGT